MSSLDIFKRILDEWNELSIALLTKGSPDDVISECCDVANFCMMLADKVNSLKEKDAEET